MQERFTISAGRVLTRAQEESDRLGHLYLGPEHLLVAILLEGDAVAARTLVGRGLDLATVRRDVAALVASPRLVAPFHGPRDALRNLGIDLDLMRDRMEAVFGQQAVLAATRSVMQRSLALFLTPHPTISW